MSEATEGMEERVVTSGPDVVEEPNIRPGQTDEGGHGGMATREQEQRLYEESADPDATPVQ